MFFLNFVRNLFVLLLSPLIAMWRTMKRPSPGYVRLRVHPQLVEVRRHLPFFYRWLPWSSTTPATELTTVRHLFELVATEKATDGVILVVPRLRCGWATCQSLVDAMKALRARNKRVVVQFEHSVGQKELFVSCYADRVFMPTRASIDIRGLSVRTTYFKQLLDKTGVRIQVFARKEYKTAAEPFSREEMSDAQRRQTQALLDEHQETLCQALIGKLQRDRQQVNALFDRVSVRADEAVELGLIDATGYEDEIARLLEIDEESIDGASSFLRYHDFRWIKPVRRPKCFAVVNVRGTIGDGRGSGARRAAINAALKRARKDKRVTGVILHVDSPGGSADASDLIHREVVRIKEEKPIVACFGDVAASGGYYIAAPAHSIVAQPLTTTGSIGVVSIRPSAGALFERMGLRSDSVQTSKFADIDSIWHPLDENETRIVDQEIDGYYDAFVSLVAEGRGRTLNDVEPLARGRVWSGEAAFRNGLLDRLGGFEMAKKELGRHLGLEESIALKMPVEVYVPAARGDDPFGMGPFGESAFFAIFPWISTMNATRKILYQGIDLPDIG
ncbi:MAG: signal peptide peptidase SppA [Polyangiales bacterium]